MEYYTIALIIVVIIVLIALGVWKYMSSSHATIVGWNFPTNDLDTDGVKNIKGLTEDECVQRCKDTEGCVGTYYWKGDDKQESHCWAKDKLVGGYKVGDDSMTHVMSGYTIPEEGNEDYYASL